jgi:hypothetical protein
MANLRLGPVDSDKPVRLSVELPAAVHRDLLIYAKAHAKETGQELLEPSKLIGPMVQRFMSTDRAFAKARRNTKVSDKTPGS